MTIRKEPFRNFRGSSPAKLKAREDQIEETKKQKTLKNIKSGTLPDGSSHLRAGLPHLLLLLGKNGAQTKRVSVLVGNQPIWDSSDHTRKKNTWQSHLSWQ